MELRDSLFLGGSPLIGLAREGAMLYTLDSGSRLQAVDISGLLAFQVLFAGVALVLLSFAKKMVASRIKD